MTHKHKIDLSDLLPLSGFVFKKFWTDFQFSKNDTNCLSYNIFGGEKVCTFNFLQPGHDRIVHMLTVMNSN